MANKLTIFFAKRSFLSVRSDIYQQIESNFSESGSRKVSTLRELFEAWAKREASRKNSVSLVYRAIVKRLESGCSFSDALKPFVPREESLVLEAGEASGRLVQALASVRGQQEVDAEIRAAVAAAISQPALSAITIALTAWFCGQSLWPDMLRVVDEQFWPGWALLLIKAEISFSNHWQFLAAIALLAGLYIWSIPRWIGRIRSVIDRIPPWSIYRDRQAAMLLNVLGGLLKSGMELDAALARVAKSSPRWLAWRVSEIKHRLVVAGSNPVSALNTGLFAPSIMDLIEDASRNKSFDEALMYLGSSAMPAIVKKVKLMAVVAGTVMTFFTGSVFVYQIAVQQIATNDATNKLIAKQGK